MAKVGPVETCSPVLGSRYGIYETCRARPVGGQTWRTFNLGPPFTPRKPTPDVDEE